MFVNNLLEFIKIGEKIPVFPGVGIVNRYVLFFYSALLLPLDYFSLPCFSLVYRSDINTGNSDNYGLYLIDFLNLSDLYYNHHCSGRACQLLSIAWILLIFIKGRVFKN